MRHLKHIRTVVILSAFICGPAFAQDHTTIKSYPDGGFSTGWTHIVNTPNGILYYNSQTGAGAVGRIDGAGNHTTMKSLSFSKGWTHIVNTPNGILYYNSQTGAAAVGRIN